MQGSPYHDPNNPILPDQPVWASAHFMAKGQLAFQGDALRVAIELRDDRGEKYRSSRIKVMSQDQKEAPSIARRVMRLWRDEQGPKRLQLDGLDWDWSDQDPTASLKEPLELILAEEQRHYAAKGRREGKLGSLSTGLQSAPNLGWTKVGDVPELLWPKGQGEPVKSPTVDRILRLHEHADVAIRRAVEERLMTYLHRASPFNNVAYAIFLALHRLGRTRDALLKANNDLRGAPAFAHSNLLGCLAAVVSREHESLSLAQIDELRTCFPENEDTEFQLREKLTLARVLKQGD
jgi:hypothetical protein